MPSAISEIECDAFRTVEVRGDRIALCFDGAVILVPRQAAVAASDVLLDVLREPDAG